MIMKIIREKIHLVKTPLRIAMLIATAIGMAFATGAADNQAVDPARPALASGEWFQPAAYVRPDKPALLDGYARQFGATPFGAPRKSLNPKDFEKLANLAKNELGITEIEGKPVGQPVLGAKGVPCIGFNRFLKGLEKIGGAIHQANAEQRKTLVAELDLCIRHFNQTTKPLTQADLNTFSASTGTANYGDLVPNFDLIINALTFLPDATLEPFAENLFTLLALAVNEAQPNIMMDDLKGQATHTILVPRLLRNPDKRYQMIARVADYYDRLIRAPWNFSPDGAPIHHSIWHYHYASYSTGRFAHYATQLHQAGWYFTPAAYERIQRIAYAAAFLTASSPGCAPFNYHGRPGQLPDIGPYTLQWLDAAAQMGDGQDPRKFQPLFAAMLLTLYPGEAKGCGAKYLAAGIRPEPTLLQGHLTMNIGALACHRRDGWLAAAGGLSPVTGKHEIYSWTQLNNYSLYAKHGSLIILDPAYSRRDNQQGYALAGAFDWSFIPGVTCPATPDYRLLVRRDKSYIQNGGMSGGCSLDGNGIWGLDQTWGPGPLFKKSAFFFAGRITLITTNIAYSEQEKAKVPTPGEKTIHTTLFQWPLSQPGKALVDNGQTHAEIPWENTGKAESYHWLVDSKGHGYVVHPAPNSSLTARRRQQAYTLCQDEFLKDKSQNPIDWKAMTIKGLGPMNDQNVLAIQKFYQPRIGDFELAFLEHAVTDGSGQAACVFDVLPMAGAAKTQELCESLQKTATAPYIILQQDGVAHILRDTKTQTIGYVIFGGNTGLLADGPIRSISAPGCLMLKESGKKLQVSIASPTDRGGKTLKITFKGAWKLAAATQGLAAEIAADQQQTVITWNQPDHRPVVFGLETAGTAERK